MSNILDKVRLGMFNFWGAIIACLAFAKLSTQSSQSTTIIGQLVTAII